MNKNRLEQERINTQEDIAEMKDETTQQRLKQQRELNVRFNEQGQMNEKIQCN